MNQMVLGPTYLRWRGPRFNAPLPAAITTSKRKCQGAVTEQFRTQALEKCRQESGAASWGHPLS